MDQPQPPVDFEITAVIRAEMNLRMHQLPPERRTTFFGPRTDAQRLIELELVFASVQHATKELRARGYWHGIVLISLDGQQFWYLPFSLFPSIVTGLPAAALETLALCRANLRPNGRGSRRAAAPQQQNQAPVSERRGYAWPNVCQIASGAEVKNAEAAGVTCSRSGHRGSSIRSNAPFRGVKQKPPT